MYVKKLRRKCGVKGCKCTDSYVISRSRDCGYSVIMCKSCLVEALEAIDAIEAPKVAPAVAEPVEPAAEPEGFVCPQCGKVCKTAQGLEQHIKLAHKDVK